MNSVRPSDGQLPRAGDIVAGKYRVESVIGAGGMGVVLSAEDTSLGRRVAIKFLAPNKAGNEDAAARFVREARAAASIQSEHVVRVFEVGSLPNGASYIVMEHLVGGDLGAVLHTRGPLPIPEALDYVLEACEAIGEAHNRGIVHRDLKPQNLFVAQTPDGSSCVKVLDFGISKAIDEAAPSLTATDAVMGTPLYMSPEQVRSLKNVDRRTDIWALGAILYELLTASPIFEAPTVTALCAMIAMDPPTPVRARRPDAPAELEAIILRCLHKDPNGRFGDVAALADALAPFASQRGRDSAARVSRVVRGAGGQAPMAFASSGAGPTGGGPTGAGTTGGGTTGGIGHATTAGYGSHYPPGAVAAAGYTAYAQQANQAPLAQRATNDAWQRPTTGAMGPGTIEQKRSGSALFAILGVVAGLFLLAIIAGAGVYIVSKKGTDAVEAQADAAIAPDAAAPTVAATAATSVAAAAGTAPAAATSKKAVAGAASGKPVSSSTPPPGAPASAAPPAAAASAEAERIARLKQNAQGRCSAQAALFRGTDQAAARQVKGMTCTSASSFSPNSGSSNCERANCRRACTILNDNTCILLLDNAERGNPLPF
ncbi:MAG: serine/threonine protein kinase [Labilithrix sp.]|nr:serine/threonine protein kinase [Labilithrix sp.]